VRASVHADAVDEPAAADALGRGGGVEHAWPCTVVNAILTPAYTISPLVIIYIRSTQHAV
jgi:hypothetical protein